jgi:hypothetical protein
MSAAPEPTIGTREEDERARVELLRAKGPDPSQRRAGLTASAAAEGFAIHLAHRDASVVRLSRYSDGMLGVDALWHVDQWLDRAPLGRDEAGRGRWRRLRDEHPAAR